MRTRDILRTLEKADFCPIGAYFTATGRDFSRPVRMWPILNLTNDMDCVVKVFDSGPNEGCWAGRSEARRAIELCREFNLIKPIEDFCHDLRVAKAEGFPCWK